MKSQIFFSTNSYPDLKKLTNSQKVFFDHLGPQPEREFLKFSLTGKAWQNPSWEHVAALLERRQMDGKSAANCICPHSARTLFHFFHTNDSKKCRQTGGSDTLPAA